MKSAPRPGSKAGNLQGSQAPPTPPPWGLAASKLLGMPPGVPAFARLTGRWHQLRPADRKNTKGFYIRRRPLQEEGRRKKIQLVFFNVFCAKCFFRGRLCPFCASAALHWLAGAPQNAEPVEESGMVGKKPDQYDEEA